MNRLLLEYCVCSILLEVEEETFVAFGGKQKNVENLEMSTVGRGIWQEN